MATVTAFTAARSAAIEAAAIVSAAISGVGHLILTRHDGSILDAGAVLGTVPDANTSTKGLVELATDAETTTGIDAVRAVTPHGLAVAVGTLMPDSSTTVKGKVQLATSAETIAGTNAVKAVTPAGLSAELAMFFQLIYPVGSVYISTAATNPSTLFGFGTWSAIQGRMLIGVDGSAYLSGATGGEATHVLTVSEMPSHTHTTRNYAGTTVGAGGRLAAATTGSASGLAAGSDQSNNTGGGAAHNNLPPYVAVYIWKRTA